MNKYELSRLISTIAIGARAAVAAENHARAEWKQTCEALPKRKPTKAASVLKYEAAERLNEYALANLHAAIVNKDVYREPFFTLLPMFDRISTLADRVELLGIHADHLRNLTEQNGCVWMVSQKMESSFAQIEAAEHGVFYNVMSFDLDNASDGDEAARDKLLAKGGYIGGVTSWGFHDGALLRSWSPFANSNA